MIKTSANRVRQLLKGCAFLKVNTPYKDGKHPSYQPNHQVTKEVVKYLGDSPKPGSVSFRYVTTRNLSSDSATIFGSSRDRSITSHYGEIQPNDLGNGEVKIPKKAFIDTLLKRRITSQGVKVIHATTEQYEHELDALSGDTLVYIHGYNTSFSSAAERVVQWANLSGFSGQVYLFSWPSKANFTDYAADRESAIWSASALKNLLNDLTHYKNHRVHLLAHSMGSLALISALQLLDKSNHLLFENIILTAPDLDAELFSDSLWPNLKSFAKQWSVYYSHKDLALKVSRRINKSPRLGENTYPIKELDFIDASGSEFDYTKLTESHDYHEKKRYVSCDMVNLIRGLTPIQRRLVRMKRGAAYKWNFQLEAC